MSGFKIYIPNKILLRTPNEGRDRLDIQHALST